MEIEGKRRGEKRKEVEREKVVEMWMELDDKDLSYMRDIRRTRYTKVNRT